MYESIKLIWRSVAADPDYIPSNEKAPETIEHMRTLYDELTRDMTPAQRDLLHKYTDYHEKICALDAENVFIAGYRIGVKLTVEGLK